MWSSGSWVLDSNATCLDLVRPGAPTPSMSEPIALDAVEVGMRDAALRLDGSGALVGLFVATDLTLPVGTLLALTLLVDGRAVDLLAEVELVRVGSPRRAAGLGLRLEGSDLDRLRDALRDVQVSRSRLLPA